MCVSVDLVREGVKSSRVGPIGNFNVAGVANPRGRFLLPWPLRSGKLLNAQRIRGREEAAAGEVVDG